MKKIFTKMVHTYKQEEVEVDLPEQPMFFQLWNYRVVTGVYPEFYSWDDGKLQGYIYHCYIGGDQKCQYFKFFDSDFKEEPIPDHNNEKWKLYQQIINDFEYDAKITEDDFNGWYGKYHQQITLPKDKIKEE